MNQHSKEVASIIVRISKLREPYRRNAIEWLRKRTNHPLEVLYPDLENFLQSLNPLVRHFLTRDIVHVLELAVKHFGSEKAHRNWEREQDLESERDRSPLFEWENFNQNWSSAWPSGSESKRNLGV